MLVDLLQRASRELAVRRGAPPAARSGDFPSLSLGEWLESFAFNGLSYPVVQTSMGSPDRERIFRSGVPAYMQSSTVFALVLARMQVFSQIRFQWTRFSGSQPGDLFGSAALGLLERPWPNGSTSSLLKRMEVDASSAGNSYIYRARNDLLGWLRPDYVTILLGSQTDAEHPNQAPDCEIAGWAYLPPAGKARYFGPEEVAHYAPLPDPHFRWLGMSWLTPVIREVQGDSLMEEHKLRFFENAATPNMVVKFNPAIGVDAVKKFKELMLEEHRGVANAYKTLFLGGGADATVVGSNFQQIDFTAVEGKGESRLAAAAGVPPSWVGFSEGLQGSSLNAGNFNSARRRFSDGTMADLWTSAAGALGAIIDPPDSGATLWYDTRVPFMRQDEGDLANIQQTQAMTIQTLLYSGFTADSAVQAVANNDWRVLKHTGLTSVQLQPPSSGEEPLPGAAGDANSNTPALPPGPATAPAGQPDGTTAAAAAANGKAG